MLDLNLHHDHQDQHLFSPNLQSSSSFSSISNPIFFMTPSDHQSLAPKLEGSCDFTMESQQQEACNPPRVDESGKGLKFKIKMREDRKEYETENINNSAKWMSSKMRMMRKMITNSDNGSTIVNHPPITITKLEDHQRLSSPDNSSNSSSCNNSSSSVRVCTDCNTTKTPLWRSGPTGPKSLCNACGIRQRKARRAMAAAANGTASDIPPPMKKVLKIKNKRPPATHNNGPQFKKRCKINIKNSPSITSSRKAISFEDLRMSLISTSGFEQVFPQDEKEAAILLMALSYGLVH